MDNPVAPQSIRKPIPAQQTPPPAASTGQDNTVFSKIFFFFLGVAIIFFSIAGGVFLYQQNAPKKASPLTGLLPNTTPAAPNENHFPEGYVTPPTSSAPQGNAITPLGGYQAGQTGTSAQSPWRLYKNSSYNFSLSFPADLTPKESEYGMGVSNVEFRSTANQDAAYSPDFQFLIFPKALGSLIGQDFEAYYAMPVNGTKIIQDPQGASQSFTKVKNRTVSGLRAIDFKTISSPPAANEQPEIGNYIEIGNSIFIISTAESNKETLEKMLQSFIYPLSQ